MKALMCQIYHIYHISPYLFRLRLHLIYQSDISSNALIHCVYNINQIYHLPPLSLAATVTRKCQLIILKRLRLTSQDMSFSYFYTEIVNFTLHCMYNIYLMTPIPVLFMGHLLGFMCAVLSDENSIDC